MSRLYVQTSAKIDNPDVFSKQMNIKLRTIFNDSNNPYVFAK